MDAVSPAERVFRAHLDQGPFQSGVDRGRWRMVSVNWPCAVIAVRAGERDNSPSEYAFRFELSNYPASPPSACPWNETNNSILEFNSWPGGQGRIPAAFRPDWKNGSCLYLPCDRYSIEGHNGWISQHPEMIWNPQGDITQYLKIIYDLLNSEDYTGVRCP